MRSYDYVLPAGGNLPVYLDSLFISEIFLRKRVRMHTVYIFFTYLYCIQYRYVEDKHVDMDIMAWRNQNTGH